MKKRASLFLLLCFFVLNLLGQSPSNSFDSTQLHDETFEYSLDYLFESLIVDEESDDIGLYNDLIACDELFMLGEFDFVSEIEQYALE